MSSVTFPSDIHDQPFYTPPAFDGASTSGFQMNPLSAHPPRTPRPSTYGGGSGYEGGTNMGMSMSISVYDPEQDEYGNGNGNGDEKARSRTRSRVKSIRSEKDNDLEKEQEKEKDDGGEVSDESEEELDEENERVKAVEKSVRAHDVWREMLVTSNGRDKVFKLMQYAIRVYLLFHSKLIRNSKSPFENELVRRLQTARSGLSFTRKMLILFNWLTPLSQITAQQAVPFASSASSLTPHTLSDPVKSSSTPVAPTYTPLLNTPTSLLSHPFLLTLLHAPPPLLLDLLNGLSDDLYTLSRLGLLSARTGARAARVADWCWFFGTLVGLVENGVEMGVVDGLKTQVEARAYDESMSNPTATFKSRPKASKHDETELRRLDRKRYWLMVTRGKLVMDLLFVSYDLLNIKRWSETVHSFTGLASGVLSAAKLFDKHKTALVKSLMNSAV